MTNNGRKIGLALSGGGYRAAAYHIGTLRALNNMGILDKVDVVSSVSGGSITAAYYALHKDDFNEFESSFTKKLHCGVLHLAILDLVLVIAAITWLTFKFKLIGFIGSFVILFFLWYKLLPVSKFIEWQYDWLFFKNKKLSDIPSTPVVSINATDYPTVSQFTFTQHGITDFYYPIGAFYHKDFPLSKAVMASSCVPFAFRPIRIPKVYQSAEMTNRRKPLLLDGGLYDNQGTHVLTDKSSTNSCNYIIVSDAGIGQITDKWMFNPLVTLKTTSNVFMERINKVQVQQNLYIKVYRDKRFAYAKLKWEVNERILDGFVDNLVAGNVWEDVERCHQIPQQDIEDLKNVHLASDARRRIITRLKQNILWNEYQTIQPSVKGHKKANKICTSLTCLTSKQISLLSNEAEWKTQMQVRLYLPFLLDNNQHQ